MPGGRGTKRKRDGSVAGVAQTTVNESVPVERMNLAGVTQPGSSEPQTGCTKIETLDKIDMIDKEIRNLRNKGNIIKSQNETLNKLYQEGREVSRKMEVKKGNSKFKFHFEDKDNIYRKIEKFSRHLIFTVFRGKSCTPVEDIAFTLV